MARTTPCVQNGVLSYWLQAKQYTLRVGSEDWKNWLQRGNRLFRFEDALGSFTARSERVCGDSYWYAYRTYNKQRNKVYLGKTENLTSEYLRAALENLIRRSDTSTEHKTEIREKSKIMPNDTERMQFAEDDRSEHTQLLIKNLTEREKEIASKIVAGMSNKEIAQTLSLSEATVKWHIHNLYEQLGLRTRSQAMAVLRFFFE